MIIEQMVRTSSSYNEAGNKFVQYMVRSSPLKWYNLHN